MKEALEQIYRLAQALKVDGDSQDIAVAIKGKIRDLLHSLEQEGTANG